jgi:hypothetical protein
MHNRNSPILIVVIKGNVEIGLEIPISGHIAFTISPMIIRYNMLNPTENNIVSDVVILISLITLNIINPGINVKYTNPTICRR